MCMFFHICFSCFLCRASDWVPGSSKVAVASLMSSRHRLGQFPLRFTSPPISAPMTWGSSLTNSNLHFLPSFLSSLPSFLSSLPSFLSSLPSSSFFFVLLASSGPRCSWSALSTRSTKLSYLTMTSLASSCFQIHRSPEISRAFAALRFGGALHPKVSKLPSLAVPLHLRLLEPHSAC